MTGGLPNRKKFTDLSNSPLALELQIYQQNTKQKQDFTQTD